MASVDNSESIKPANDFIKLYFPEHPEYEVNKKTYYDAPFIFTTRDETKIIKFMKYDEYLSNSISMYERLSLPDGGCNICKLLNYTQAGDVGYIIVIENCGNDLSIFMKRSSDGMNIKRLLQLSHELLKQIICLQKETHVVHGDIKPENIAVKVNTLSGDLEVKLIDFDYVAEITRTEEGGGDGDGGGLGDGGGKYSVLVRNITRWHETDTRNNNKTVTGISKYIKQLSKNKNLFIKHVLGIDDINLFTNGLNAYYNIPTEFGEIVMSYNQEIKDRKITGSLDYLHIIDLCSWSYVVAYAIQICLEQKINTSDRGGGIFVCNVLVAIVMNIMIPNHNRPLDPPLDCFGRIINKEYCDKVVNGISVLLKLLSEGALGDERYVHNKGYTHSKTKLFFDLIQECHTEDELYTRFKDIIDKNYTFYSKNYSFEQEQQQTIDAFNEVKSHIHVASAGGEAGAVPVIHTDDGGSAVEAGGVGVGVGGYRKNTRNNKKRFSKMRSRKCKLKSRKLRMKKNKRSRALK
jgi:serine/threonine protein kinase